MVRIPIVFLGLRISLISLDYWETVQVLACLAPDLTPTGPKTRGGHYGQVQQQQQCLILGDLKTLLARTLIHHTYCYCFWTFLCPLSKYYNVVSFTQQKDNKGWQKTCLTNCRGCEWSLDCKYISSLKFFGSNIKESWSYFQHGRPQKFMSSW